MNKKCNCFKGKFGTLRNIECPVHPLEYPKEFFKPMTKQELEQWVTRRQINKPYKRLDKKKGFCGKLLSSINKSKIYYDRITGRTI